MQVITIESETYKEIVNMVSTILTTVERQAQELKQLKDNRLMGVKEVMEYTGFGTGWINSHKADIGYVQIGAKDLKFWKNDIDAYLKAHFVQRKIRKSA
jgi:hypothetical protein